jgi:hypothetical protein
MATPTPTPSRAAVPAARFAEPAFVCTYGPSGSGKSTDAGYSFPTALFLAAPGALKPLITVCGYDPHRAKQVLEIGMGGKGQIATIKDATAAIRAHAGRVGAVVVDDFSYLAELTFAHYEALKLTGYKLFGAVREDTLDFRDACRYAGVHVSLNCWERAPTVKNGVFVKGGPKLHGDLPEAMPGICDMVLRCGIEPERKPWKGVYRAGLDTDYVTKDRHNVVQGVAPMNTAEVLRFAGYTVPRHPGLPWQEEAVERIASALVAAPPADEAQIGRTAIEVLTGRGYAAPYVAWTLRDALDRAALRRMHSNPFSAFGWSA